MVEWQHRTAKEFAVDRKRVCKCYSTLNGQTRGVLGKRRRLRCGQPLSVDLDHQVSGLGQEKRRQIGVKPASVTVCNIIFLCQHLGVAPEAGAYSQDKMSDPAYKPPLRF